MRKFSLLLVALLVVTTGAFAQVSIEPEIEVEAKSTWGVNLDDETHGFSNLAKATLSYVFTEEQTQEFGEGDVYGWIELEDFKIEIDSENTDDSDGGQVMVTTGDISAKLMLGPIAYIDILSATDGVDEAGDITKISQNITTVNAALIAATSNTVTEANVFTEYTYSAGVALGVALPDMVTVEFGVLSGTDWNGADTNPYMLSLDAEIVAVPDLTVALVATMEFDDDDVGTDKGPAGVGASVEYSLPLDADLTLIPQFGLDYKALTGGDNSQIEISAGAFLSWAGLGTDEDDETIFGNEAELSSGLGLGVVYGIHDLAAGEVNTLGIKAGLYEDSGDDGLLPVVGGAFLLNYNMVSGDVDRADLGLGVELNADLGVVEPFFGVTYLMQNLNEDQSAETESYAYLNLGTDINVVANTTFTVEYKSGELANDAGADNNLYGDAYSASSRESGQVAITTKIEF